MSFRMLVFLAFMDLLMCIGAYYLIVNHVNAPIGRITRELGQR